MLLISAPLRKNPPSGDGRKRDTMQIMELTAQEIDRAIADINALVREAYRCPQGDFGWLDDANLENWLQALEQDGAIEVPSFFTLSGRVERVRRIFIESKPTGGAA